MKKSMIFLSCLLIASFINISFAFDYPNLTPDEAAKQFMLDHQGPNDPWEGQNPQIAGKQFFYSASDKTPSYIEYKVSCNDTKNCGSVLVNLDGTTNTIALGSFAGLAMFESIGLTAEESLGEVPIDPKKLIPDPNVKYYYFSMIHAFSFNESNGEIKVLNPFEKYLEQEHKQALLSKKSDSQLAQMFNGFRELSAKTLAERVGKQENKRLESNPISRALRATYIGSEINAGSCRSYTPCYTQGRRTYPGHTGTHPTGCIPTAFSIVMGFYDRTNFPNILEGVLAPVTNNQNIVTMQTELGNLMGTHLSESGGGATSSSNFSQGWRYLDGKYSYSSDYHTWRKVRKIKSEINAGRPAIIQLTFTNWQGDQEVGHSAVVHGYQGDTLYVNLGWGPTTLPNAAFVMDGDDFQVGNLAGHLNRVDVATLSNN